MESLRDIAPELKKAVAETLQKAVTEKTAANWKEIEHVLSNISTQRGVRGVVVVVAATGQIVCDTFEAEDRELALKTATMAVPLLKPTIELAAACGETEVELMRVRSDKAEILLMPKGEYVLLVMQTTHGL